MSDNKPASLATRLFRVCLLLLGAAIALNIAVDLLRCIWPWLLGAALITVAGWIAWRIYRQRSGGW